MPAAVIAIQEWWGVTEEDKKRAGRIVKAGKYRCIIPDLYKGKIGVDAEVDGHEGLEYCANNGRLFKFCRRSRCSSGVKLCLKQGFPFLRNALTSSGSKPSDEQP
jgi:hypothetical protein